MSCERSRPRLWGAVVHAENSQPLARASGSSVGSPSQRTEWPRATSRRARESSGGTLPPPSQLTNEKRFDSVIGCSFRAGASARCPARDERLERLVQGLLRQGALEPKAPPQRVPGVDLRRHEQLCHAAAPQPPLPLGKKWRECGFQP